MAMKASVTVFLFWSLFGLNTSLYRQHFYVDVSKQWWDAQTYCKTNYDDLSTVSNEELKQLSANPAIRSDFFWIGLRRDASDPYQWRWSRGEEATDVKWENGQPNSVYEEYGAVSKSTHEVHDYGWGGNFPFYCMKVFELILVEQESTWEEALKYCRQNYFDLASLSSDVIMTEAIDASKPALADDVWIGLRFIAANWFWVNGEDLNKKGWSGGESQCPAMDQRCGVYDRKKMAWKPADCEKRLNFLCVKKA